MRENDLNSLLVDLNRTSADIEASAVISKDGLIMASMLPAGLDEDRVGAMSAAMLSLGERTSAELQRGELNQVLISGSEGYIVLAHAGNEAVVSVLARPDAKLGLIFLDIKRAATAVTKIL